MGRLTPSPMRAVAPASNEVGVATKRLKQPYSSLE